MNKILVLWSHMRSRSTAFTRMMTERGDFFVMNEPFARYYYFSDERASYRRSDVEPQPEYRFDAILRGLLQKSETQALFFKEHPYYVAHRADLDFISHFQNTFIIRHPAQALPSLYHKMPDFTLEEASYKELYQLFEFAKATEGTAPVLIDADDLVEFPEAVIRAYCEAVGISFLPEALVWEPKLPPVLNPDWWDSNINWYSNLEKSQGFKRQSNTTYVSMEDNEHLKQVYDFCLPYYQKLYEHRLRIT